MNKEVLSIKGMVYSQGFTLSADYWLQGLPCSLAEHRNFSVIADAHKVADFGGVVVVAVASERSPSLLKRGIIPVKVGNRCIIVIIIIIMDVSDSESNSGV